MNCFQLYRSYDTVPKNEKEHEISYILCWCRFCFNCNINLKQKLYPFRILKAAIARVPVLILMKFPMNLNVLNWAVSKNTQKVKTVNSKELLCLKSSNIQTFFLLNTVITVLVAWICTSYQSYTNYALNYAFLQTLYHFIAPVTRKFVLNV